ncbi:MAG: Rrf2 family transcriptional regulator [Magnetococcales bacterium]|nr:Rrf2 family transcriptional regulator [Magnetococcales bacterium]
MMKFSKKLVCAIEAVVDIAYNSKGKPVQSREVTHRQGVPQRYLEQMMQRLVKAGILKGVRGPHGGYVLARERSRISVGDIARAAMYWEHKVVNDDPPWPEQVANGPIGKKVIRPLWAEFEWQILEMMDRVTLDDLIARARLAGVSGHVMQCFSCAV